MPPARLKAASRSRRLASAGGMLVASLAHSGTRRLTLTARHAGPNLTKRLYDVDREPEQHLLGAGRPHAPRDPVAARFGRGIGDGAGRAVRHEPAGDLEAF